MAHRLPWFRMWTEARTDVKLRQLSAEEHRVWFSLMCLAGEAHGHVTVKGNGTLLALEVADGNRALLDATVEKLEQLFILQRTDTGYVFINWDKRQHDKPSDHPDAVKERVTRHRETRRNAAKRDETLCNALEERRVEESRVEETREEPPYTPPADDESVPPPDEPAGEGVGEPEESLSSPTWQGPTGRRSNGTNLHAADLQAFSRRVAGKPCWTVTPLTNLPPATLALVARHLNELDAACYALDPEGPGWEEVLETGAMANIDALQRSKSGTHRVLLNVLAAAHRAMTDRARRKAQAQQAQDSRRGRHSEAEVLGGAGERYRRWREELQAEPTDGNPFPVEGVTA